MPVYCMYRTAGPASVQYEVACRGCARSARMGHAACPSGRVSKICLALPCSKAGTDGATAFSVSFNMVMGRSGLPALSLLALSAAEPRSLISRLDELTSRVEALAAENTALRDDVLTLQGRLDAVEQLQPTRRDRTVRATVDAEPSRSDRRLTSSGPTCCRWTHDAACGSNIAEQRHYKCTGLFEYLESKTTTHEFELSGYA